MLTRMVLPRRRCWQFVALALLSSVVIAFPSSYNGSGSSSAKLAVEFWSESGSGDEIQFPGNSEFVSDVNAKEDAAKTERSGETEIVASPVVTAPPLVLQAESAPPLVLKAVTQQVNASAVNRNESSMERLSTSQVVVALTAESKQDMHGVPSNPTLVNAVAFDGRAAVTWKAPDDDGLDPVTAYEVGWFDEEENELIGTQKVTVASGNEVDLAILNTSNSNAAAEMAPTSTVVGPLVNGRSYTFKVRAQNVNGFSVWSAKSLAVSPLHPPDLCERLSCSGHGTCFPNYHADKPSDYAKKRQKRDLTAMVVQRNPKMSRTAIDDFSLDAVCVCRPGYSPPDCSAKSTDDAAQYVWQVTEWSECDSGCGGGRRSREAICFDIAANERAPSEEFCADTRKPSISDICNGIECGSKRVVVKYEVETSYDEVLFSPTAIDAFEMAFTTEVASALQIPRSRLEITALARGSIVVFFQILPASRVGEKSLNEIVETLQDQLGNSTSTLRSMGTFARRIEPDGVKLSFSIADQTVAGGAEDISIAGLIGTMIVLAFFVSMFAWFLRRRHYRLLQDVDHKEHEGDKEYTNTNQSGLKRMTIKTTT